VLVNPELLRGFASEVGTASGDIQSADVGHKASTAADGLPGSATQWAVHLVGAHISEQVGKIAKGVGDVGVAVRGAADKYEVEDGSLAGSFNGLFK